MVALSQGRLFSPFLFGHCEKMGVNYLIVSGFIMNV